MSTTPNPAGARERDVFMAMLARLDAELDRDLASSKKPLPDAEPQTDFVPTLQLLKEDEMAALAAQPRDPSPRRAPRAARPPRPLIARLLPWLVGGGLAASAASFAVSFTGTRPPSVPAPAAVTAAVPTSAAVTAAVPTPAAVTAAAPAPAAVAPAPTPAAVAPAAPIPEPASPAPVVVAVAPEAKVPAAAADPGPACPPARRALGLCDVQAP